MRVYKPLKKLDNIRSEKSVKQCHKHLWEWIAKESPTKEPWIEGLRNFDNSYLCYWAETKKQVAQFRCNACLVQTKCWELHSLYDDWRAASKRDDAKTCRKLAKQIAALFD